MTDDTLDGTAITTRHEFEIALKRVVAEASRNGVDPRGSVVCRTDGDGTDLEVVVVKLEDEPSD